MARLPEVEPVDQAIAVNLETFPAGRGQYRPDSHTVHHLRSGALLQCGFLTDLCSNRKITITALTNPTDFLKP